MIKATIVAISLIIAAANVTFTPLKSPEFNVVGVYYSPDTSLP